MRVVTRAELVPGGTGVLL